MEMKEKIIDMLSEIELKAPLLQDIQVSRDEIIILIEIKPEQAGEMEPLRLKAERHIKSAFSAHKVSAILTAAKKAPEMPEMDVGQPKMTRPPAKENLKPEGVKHIIAVASGKGGVGKSTIAVNLALALKGIGKKVGLMDADIYGPSIPRMLGVEGDKAQMKDKKVKPIEAYGLKLMSIGFLVDPDQPMIWRGPMIQSALRQFLQDVDWGALDVLVVDMPPGTGDAQLTMAQKVPMTGAVIVSTPQDIALIDARKGIEMFRAVDVPILGLIENMSTHICSNCGHEEHLFGHGTLKAEAQKYDVPFLGEIPLSRTLREQMDMGSPENNDQSSVFDQIIKKIAL